MPLDPPLRGHSDIIYSVAFSPDDAIIATCSLDKTVRLWDAHTGAPLETITGHDYPVKSVGFDREGKALVSIDNRGTIRIHRFETRARP